MIFSHHVLIDTDVLIDALREFPPAKEYVEQVIENASISSLTAVELWAGIRNNKEEKKLRDLLSQMIVIEASNAVIVRACEMIHQFGRSHGVGTVDAIIAASAEVEGLKLITLNKKHFPMLQNIFVPYKKS